MLEVRFQAIGFDCVINELKKQGTPDDIIPVIRTMVDMLSPSSEALDSEYIEAMKTVSKTAPLLAYEYRSRNTIPNYLRNLRKIASEQGMPLNEVENMESQLSSLIIPKLNELILHLAEMHSRKSAKSVREILERPIEMPKEFSNFIETYKDRLFP